MIDISKICFSNPKKTNSFIKTDHFFPSQSTKKIFGELISLIEIEIPKNLNKEGFNLAKEISEIIINGIRTNYYNPEKLKDEENPEIIFENSLQKLNRLIYQEIIGSRSIESIIKNLNAVIALIHEERVYFSPVGSVQVFILKKNKIIDLMPKEKTIFTPSKIFFQIVSGTLEKNDCLFFTTANFLDYFVFEKLNNIILKYSVSEATKKLEEILENLKDKISLGAFILKRIEKKIPKEIPVEVEKIEKVPVKITVQSAEEKIKEKPIIQEIKKEEKPPIEKPKIKIEFPIKKISFPRIKINTFLIIILIIFLVLTLIKGQIKEKEMAKFLLAFQEIQTKNTLLEASIAYKDLKKAKFLAEEIKNKITLIRAKTKIEKEILENLKKAFEENIDKLYGFERIREPKILIDFSSLDKNGEFTGLTHKNGYFFVFNQRTKEIYEFNQKTNKISPLVKTDLIIQKIINYSSEELILIGQNDIRLFNIKNKKISPLKIESTTKELTINDLTIYENKLYILDKKNNQIFKYLKVESGFGRETSWLKEKVDLKDIVSFVIDGSIYLLKGDEILKFYLGKKVNFNLENVYPSLEKAKKIFTEIDLKNIYLLEPKNKRVLIFEKNGKFVKQITSEKFTDLKDFIVDEKKNKIWLLNGSQIFSLDLNK